MLKIPSAIGLPSGDRLPLVSACGLHPLYFRRASYKTLTTVDVVNQCYNMASLETWTALPSDDNSISESFLLQSSKFDSDSYTLYITDLISTWKEHRSRGNIIDRANNQNCVIDASGDESEFQLLLSVLKSTIQEESDAVVTTRMSPTGLKLMVSTKVPEYKQPFVWTFELTKVSSIEPVDTESSPEEDMEAVKSTRAITFGLAGMVQALQCQVSELCGLLTIKDFHIRNLQDSLEELGTPYIPRRHRDGWPRFQADKWLNDWKSSRTLQADVGQVLCNVLRPPQSLWGYHANGNKWTDREIIEIRKASTKLLSENRSLKTDKDLMADFSETESSDSSHGDHFSKSNAVKLIKDLSSAQDQEEVEILKKTQERRKRLEKDLEDKRSGMKRARRF